MTSPSFMCSTYVMELASAITGMVPSPTSFTRRSQGLARSSGVAASELWGIERLYDLVFVRGLGRGFAWVCARLDLGSAQRLQDLETAGAHRVAADATSLYARNLLNFLTLLIDKETKGLKINWEDEIVKGVALTRDGQIIHPNFKA